MPARVRKSSCQNKMDSRKEHNSRGRYCVLSIENFQCLPNSTARARKHLRGSRKLLLRPQTTRKSLLGMGRVLTVHTPRLRRGKGKVSLAPLSAATGEAVGGLTRHEFVSCMLLLFGLLSMPAESGLLSWVLRMFILTSMSSGPMTAKPSVTHKKLRVYRLGKSSVGVIFGAPNCFRRLYHIPPSLKIDGVYGYVKRLDSCKLRILTGQFGCRSGKRRW
jgi:hypothetical protein